MEDYLEEEDYVIYRPQDEEICSERQCEELITSEEFDVYVTTLADRNPYAVRVGLAAGRGRFIMDLLRCTAAARDTFDSQLAFEGTTLDEYKEQHSCECMISRDECFRTIEMPNELTAVPLNKIIGMVGTLTEQQEKQYHEKTRELDGEEIKVYIERFREFTRLLGWKHIFEQDAEYEENN